MEDADVLLMLPGLFQLAEQRVKETEIVVREVDPIRVLVEKGAIIVQGVIFHPEAGVHAAEHRVHVYLGQPGISQRPLVRRIADGEGSGCDAVGRKNQPQHPQRSKNAQQKNEYLFRSHRTTKILILIGCANRGSNG